MAKRNFNCLLYEKDFQSNQPNAKKCNSCSKKRQHFIFKKLSTASVGAIGELMVSVDLAKKGYEVFRAISPASSCDLLVLKNKKILKIEVRTGHRGYDDKKGGKLYYVRSNKADVMAIVIHKSNEIVYIPKLSK